MNDEELKRVVEFWRKLNPAERMYLGGLMSLTLNPDKLLGDAHPQWARRLAGLLEGMSQDDYLSESLINSGYGARLNEFLIGFEGEQDDEFGSALQHFARLATKESDKV